MPATAKTSKQKWAIFTYAYSKTFRRVSPEPLQFAYIRNFSQRTRQVVSLKDRACAMKGWTDENSEKHFYRDKSQIYYLHKMCKTCFWIELNVSQRITVKNLCWIPWYLQVVDLHNAKFDLKVSKVYILSYVLSLISMFVCSNEVSLNEPCGEEKALRTFNRINLSVRMPGHLARLNV